MDIDRFDRLTRTVSHALSRRRLTTALGLVASGTIRIAEAKKKKRKKIKKNAFGCVNVGKACRGKDANCCSGICEGKKPKKGKKDKSRCVAHNELDCPAGADSCLQGLIPCGTQPGPGLCRQTTGQASHCGMTGGPFVACQKDIDCEPDFGPGAACIVCAGNVSCFAAAS